MAERVEFQIGAVLSFVYFPTTVSRRNVSREKKSEKGVEQERPRRVEGKKEWREKKQKQPPSLSRCFQGEIPAGSFQGEVTVTGGKFRCKLRESSKAGFSSLREAAVSGNS